MFESQIIAKGVKLFEELGIEIPIKNILNLSHLPEVYGKTIGGINWKVCVVRGPAYFNLGHAYQVRMDVDVNISSTAAASSMKKPFRAEVTLGLKHVKGGGYNKELGSINNHTLNVPSTILSAPDGIPLKLSFNITDIVVYA
jgi:hypothetical protein